MKPVPLPQLQPGTIVFDKDDEAACDDLLMDILSGDGDDDGGCFLPLLADDPCNGQHASPPPFALGSLNNFVKQEVEF